MVDVNTGKTEQIASLVSQDKPQANHAPKDFIAREQQQLIEFVQVERQQRAERFAQQQELQQKSFVGARILLSGQR